MRKLEVHNPWDGSLLETLPLLAASDLEGIIARAQTAHQTPLHQLPAHARVAILEQFLQLMTQQREALIHLAIAEGGKPRTDTEGEFMRALDGVKTALAEMRTWSGEEIPMGYTKASAGRIAFTRYEPIGVVAAFSAFNHPINLFIHQVIPAVAVGTPVIYKPAPDTPLTGIRLTQLLAEAGLPQPWCQTIVIDNESAAALAGHPGIAAVNFIGSARVGWQLRQRLAPGTRLALEHGGAAPVIIDETADLKEALPILCKGAFYHAGQVCVSVQRIFAHRSIAARVAEELSELAAKLRVGNPQESSTDVGPLIRTAEAQRIDQWVQEAIAEDAQCLCGGTPLPEHNSYAPTVLFGPSTRSRVMQEEIFGPVVSVVPYDTIDEAIAQANNLPYTFQAAIFTQNYAHAMRAGQRLQAATVLVNDSTTFRTDWMPFAGHAQSGLGAGGIRYTMEEYSRRKLWVLKMG
ncbi:MAG: aldehyde dehydrogenase family protein [Bacteroidetes bacterium]|nr:aldehyde dehydrogenase family protein [Bacteroidota bacterium]